MDFWFMVDFDTKDYILFCIVYGVVFFVFPLAWRENNSWWFSVIKFWFGIFPAVIGCLGIMFFGIGIFAAIEGLINLNGNLLFTFIYFWLIILFSFAMILPKKTLKKLNTL